MKRLEDIFSNPELVRKIQERLPKFFHIAEMENERNGVGMQVGFLREKILVALFVHVFGEENVNSDISTNEHEVDVVVFNKPVSIKTMTGNGKIKLSWTVDPEKALRFSKNYRPGCDMFFTHIRWGSSGGIYLFAKESQFSVMNEVGTEGYITIPKPGTNPRGADLNKNALKKLIEHPNTRHIPIQWEKTAINHNPLERWLKLWEK